MTRRYLFVKARGKHSEFNTVSPPLGLLILAAIARDELQKQIAFFDTYLHDEYHVRFRELIESFRPDVVAISALTAESECMHDLAKIAAELSPDATVIAGGPHPTAYPDDTLKNNAIDLAVINEGEITFREIIASLDQGGDGKSVAGVAFRGADEKIVFTRQQQFIIDLDSIPYPAFDLVDFDGYARLTAFTPVRRRRYMNIMTSRGCPYRCTYCHTIQGKKFRSHSPAYVLRMIETLMERYAIRHFEFIDDIFNWDAERTNQIMHEIISRRLNIRFSFPNALRGDRLETSQIALMARAGLDFTAIAVESANAQRQKQMKKFLDIGHVQRSINALVENGIFTCGFFMLGFPGETREEMMNTINFALRSKLHMAYFLTVTPFQGTEIHHQALEAQLVPNEMMKYEEQYVDQKINLSSLSDKEFFWISKYAYLRFYLNPLRIIRIMRDVPTRMTLLIRLIGLLRVVLRTRASSQPLRLFRQKLARLLTNQRVEEDDVNVFYRRDRQASRSAPKVARS